MSLIPFTLLFFPVVGFITGVFVGASYGGNDVAGLLIGGGLGGIAGGFAGLVAHFLLWGGIIALIHFSEWWRPSYPSCHQGRCGSDDYKHLWLDADLAEADRQLAQRVVQDGIGLLVRCHCGDRYVNSVKHRRLLEVSPDGTLRPYRYYKPFGRKWLADSPERSAR